MSGGSLSTKLMNSPTSRRFNPVHTCGIIPSYLLRLCLKPVAQSGFSHLRQLVSFADLCVCVLRAGCGGSETEIASDISEKIRRAVNRLRCTSYAGVVGYTHNAVRVVGYSSDFTSTSCPVSGKKIKTNHKCDSGAQNQS